MNLAEKFILLAFLPIVSWDFLLAQETFRDNDSDSYSVSSSRVNIDPFKNNWKLDLKKVPVGHPLNYRWRWDTERNASLRNETERAGAVREFQEEHSDSTFDSLKELRSTIYPDFPLKYREEPLMQYKSKVADFGVALGAYCGRPFPGGSSVWFSTGSKIIERIVVNGIPKDQEILEYAPGWLIYSFAFSPSFSVDKTIFLFCNGIRDKLPRNNRILSWKLEDRDGSLLPEEPPKTILEWESNGHDGGDLLFGKDGYLYIATGDGSQDSDQFLSAQNYSDLRGGILRIDVSEISRGLPYKIPPDNPFLDVPNARPELYAKGLRNPWRMTMDRQTGAIFLGNSGQDTTESVYLLEPGANYGWSVWEGNKLFHEKRPLGPGKLTFPLVDHGHDEARALTGGIVYRGKKFPELFGYYIYGDYETGRIWGALIENNQFVSIKELANAGHNIVGFYESPSGDIVVLGPTVYHLERNDVSQTDQSVYFPHRLSETGLFEAIAEHRLNSSVVRYEIGAPSWHDGARAQRFFYVAGGSKIGANESGGWSFPQSSVVIQTLSLPSGLLGKERDLRVETRLLVNRGREWSAYSYLWNRNQTDASLVERSGLTVDLEEHFGVNPSIGKKIWSIPSRSACYGCHNFNRNTVLGLTTLQLKSHVPVEDEETQLDRWESEGRLLLKKKSLGTVDSNEKLLVDPHDSSKPLEQRVRSYLHANCGNCHVGGGNGGGSKLNLQYHVPIESTGMLDSFPEHSDYGLSNARIVAPGFPQRSILLRRISSEDGGKMPPLGRSHVDQAAIKMISDWISGLSYQKNPVKEWSFDEMSKVIEARESVEAAEQLANGKGVYDSTGCAQCHRIGNVGIGYGPDLTKIGLKKNRRDILRSILEPSFEIAPEYRSWYYRLESNRVIEGVKVSETNSTIEIMVKDGNGQLLKLQKSEIEEVRESNISSMPKGLLSQISQEDILDLIDFIYHN